MREREREIDREREREREYLCACVYMCLCAVAITVIGTKMNWACRVQIPAEDPSLKFELQTLFLGFSTFSLG